MTEKNETATLHLPKAMAKALAFVLSSDPRSPPSIEALRELEDQLAQWSGRCEKELKTKLRVLRKDHPLRCSVGLFGPMGMGRMETSHTKVLAWLLDPKKEHGFKKLLLKALLQRVKFCCDDRTFTVREIVAEQFYKNSGTKDCGRTDIWIEGSWEDGSNTSRWLVVIEAKVDAFEGPSQLDRYDQQIRSQIAKGNEVCKIFLTPDGKAATGKNAGWRVLSFEQLAKSFWDIAKNRTKASGYEFLRLYIAGIFRDVLEWPVGSELDELDAYRLLGFLSDSVDTTNSEPTMATTQALGFCLRHWNKMQSLLGEDGEAEKKLRSQLPAAQREMVERVGFLAQEQVGTILGKCGSILESRFDEFDSCHAKALSRTKTISTYWMVDVSLRPKWSRKHQRIPLYACAAIDKFKDGAPSIYLYLFGQGTNVDGRRNAEAQIKKILKDRAIKAFEEMVYYAGSVAFAEITIPVRKDFEIDVDTLFGSVERAVNRIQSGDVKNMLKRI